MRTFLYHKRHAPMGKIFDTLPGQSDPLIPDGWKALGWSDVPVGGMTTDELIDVLVREELAKQNPDKPRLEAEYTRKTGEVPHFAAKEKTLVSVLDDNHAKERKRK